MEKERISVGMIYGGRGYEREVSILGYNNLVPHIDPQRYRITPIHIEESGLWRSGDKEVIPAPGGLYCPREQEKIKLDCAIPLLHGDHGEDGSVQGALECASIPYVGCDVMASAICRDKAILKAVASDADIPTLPHVLLLRDEGVDYAIRACEEMLRYPMFIKPTRLGSSIGAAAVSTRRELVSQITIGFTLCARLMAEPCLTEKREVECAYYSGGGREIITHPGEIRVSGTYGYEEKYRGGAEVVTRADIPEVTAELIRDYTRRLVRKCGIRDISRIDYLLRDGEIYLNEINTMPGMTAASLYPAMLEGAGIPTGKMLSGLIDSAVARG